MTSTSSSDEQEPEHQSYEQLSSKIRTIHRKMLSVYIPKLCDAVKDEYPFWPFNNVWNEVSYVLEEEMHISRNIYEDILRKELEGYHARTVSEDTRQKMRETQQARSYANRLEK